MTFHKVIVAYKRYMMSPEVKAVCDGRIYKGLVKIYTTAINSDSVKNASTEDLDSFYSKSPAMVKLFKMSNINKFITALNGTYDSWPESARKFDVYCKAMIFLSMIKLIKFWMATLTADINADVASTGVSKSVFARVKTVEKILDISMVDMKAKNPDKPTLTYLEMGLKRIISMEVGSDDWDK